MSYHTPTKPPNWVIDRIHECLTYDESKRSVIWSKPRAKSIKVGARAGRVDSHGHLQVLFSDKDLGQRNVFAHHIVWFLHTGEWPTQQLDHKDTDRQNNSFDNLRLASNSQQTANSNVRSDSESGIKNICWHKLCQKWQVAVHRKGKAAFHAYFCSLEEAIRARDKAIVAFHGEFARSE